MRGWKFWEKEPAPPPEETPASEPQRRFSARPRTDLVDPARTADPAAAEQLERLRKRREAVLFDVERAQQANEEENPWRERARLLDGAIETARAERAARAAERTPAGAALPATPISGIEVDEGPPPRVRFTIGDQLFTYAEELDWAERGFQIARGDLIRQEGNHARLIPAGLPAEEGEALAAHLDQSLFVFASDLRDRALAGQSLPDSPALADLARPSAEEGGWLDWAGHSPARAARELMLRELEAEIARLVSERERVLEEERRWADRLPIALRRLAAVDAEIAELGG